MHLIPSSNLGLFFQVKKVRKFVLDNGFDIIHAHLPWAGILARFVGNKIKIPIVYTEHNTWERYNRLSYWGNRITFKHQDVAVAVSNEVALSMQLNSIFDPYKRGGRLKVRVVQNGVNTDEFRKERSIKYQVPSTKYQVPSTKYQVASTKYQVPSTKYEESDAENEDSDQQKNVSNEDGFSNSIRLKDELGIPKAAPVIGKVAVFRTQKRLWLWVEIALKLLEKHPDIHFLLVGDGEWREKLEKQIKDSGKRQNFHLVGVQKMVIPYLSLMDIYLSSSEFEGLPIAMLEAMSCEVPVVATRAGGIGEVIQQGVHGFLCEVEKWKELEGYCLKLLENPELHQKMSLAARERVIEKFSMNRMVGELEEIYREVLGLG